MAAPGGRYSELKRPSFKYRLDGTQFFSFAGRDLGFCRAHLNATTHWTRGAYKPAREFGNLGSFVIIDFRPNNNDKKKNNNKKKKKHLQTPPSLFGGEKKRTQCETEPSDEHNFTRCVFGATHVNCGLHHIIDSISDDRLLKNGSKFNN